MSGHSTAPSPAVLEKPNPFASQDRTVAYIANDLTDAIVRKRVAMLQTAGARVKIGGFRRAGPPPADIHGCVPVDLGETFDRKLAHRAMTSLLAATVGHRKLSFVKGADAVLARNLETLAIAIVARALYAPRAALVYECLDIHRSLTGSGIVAKVLRSVERLFLGQTNLLITSSPAFIEAYFRPRQGWSGRTLLVENKMFSAETMAAKGPCGLTQSRTPIAPPWRIGWFGMLRGQQSLDALCEIAKRSAGAVEVIIRGRPGDNEFKDFLGQIAAAPGVSYLGPYVRAELAQMYADVHFCWAMDLSSDAGNPVWLLPNRIYESSIHGCPPICLAGTETGKWATQRGLTLIVEDPEVDVAEALLSMTQERYDQERAALANIPPTDLICDEDECRTILNQIVGV